MKNSRLIAALLAATLMISCAPVQAVEQKSRLSKVKKQLNESLDRFKRCVRGKCDRREALKVARDVGIAAAAVLALVGGGLYLARTAFSCKKHDDGAGQAPAQRVGEPASLHRAQPASWKKQHWFEKRVECPWEDYSSYALALAKADFPIGGRYVHKGETLTVMAEPWVALAPPWLVGELEDFLRSGSRTVKRGGIFPLFLILKLQNKEGKIVHLRTSLLSSAVPTVGWISGFVDEPIR